MTKPKPSSKTKAPTDSKPKPATRRSSSKGLGTAEIMDVNRPGKNHAIVGSSRPVVSSPVTSTVQDDIVTSAEKVKDTTPSVHKLVITPISDALAETEDNVGINIVVDSKDKSADESVADISQDDTVASESLVAEPTEPTESTEETVSDASGVDMLATNVAEKLKAKQRADEEAKRKLEVAELIASKEYYVQIIDAKTRRMRVVLLVLGLLALLTGSAVAYVVYYQ